MRLHQYIYTSVLAPGESLDTVSSIIRIARAHNPKLNVTGILLFDGTNFCQYLEGPEANLNWLVERIAKDPRHSHFTERHASALEGPRHFPNWNCAYSDKVEDDLDRLFSSAVDEKPMDRLNTLVDRIAPQITAEA